jgi:subtilisin family serine protease
LNKAETAGVFVAAASGNDGRSVVSYPAAADTVLAVGAVDSNLVKADFSNWGPELDVMGPGVDVVSSVPRGTGRGAAVEIDLDGKGLNSIKSLPFVGSPVASSDKNTVVYAGLGKPEDFSGVDVKGKIALISRGEISFADKVNAAISNGAAAVLIYNNAPGLIQGTVTQDGTEVAIPVAMIEQSIGESAKAALASGQAIKASLDIQRTDYASFMGTSMATPHVAGVAALVRAANHSLTPAQVRDVLKTTATALSPNDQNQYGSGLVNAESAVSKAQTMGLGSVRQAAN